MFCVNCGKEINDNQKFCRYCGAKNEVDNDLASSDNEILNNTQSRKVNTVFNRDVLNNYLYNIRTLEFSKNSLLNKKQIVLQQINSLGYSNYANRKYSFDLSGYGDIWGCCVGLVFIEIIVGALLNWIFDVSWIFIIGCIIVAILIALGITIVGLIEDFNKKKNFDEAVRQDDIRVINELKNREQLNNHLPDLEAEIDKIENLLTESYSVNLIPSKFRNIYAAYFLYDFISTSTASLNEALLHCDLDTIQQKLDEVIQQQEEMIMELAYQNALNEKIVRQNEQILGHAIETENNTALAAQYTKIAANNTGVVAAIQMSEYLRP